MLADNQDLIYSNYFCEELHAAEGSKYTQIHTHTESLGTTTPSTQPACLSIVSSYRF